MTSAEETRNDEESDETQGKPADENFDAAKPENIEDDDDPIMEIDDEKHIITGILQNLGDFPVPEIDDDSELDFNDIFLYDNTETKTDSLEIASEYLPQKITLPNGKEYFQVFENFGYVCSNCGTEISMKSKSCPSCNVKFAYIKCEKCRFVGEREDFKNHVCPQCHAAPVIIPKENVQANLCPNCNRPYNKGEFNCKLCGWVDFGALAWLAALAILIGVGLPIFSILLQGIAADIMYHAGFFFGGLLLWNFAHAIIRAYDRPRRISFYWFCAIVSASILLVLNFGNKMSYEIQVIIFHSFLFIVIGGEFIALLKKKSEFCKGKATVGLIIRRHLYPSTLIEETIKSGKIPTQCNLHSMKKTESYKDFETNND